MAASLGVSDEASSSWKGANLIGDKRLEQSMRRSLRKRPQWKFQSTEGAVWRLASSHKVTRSAKEADPQGNGGSQKKLAAT
jgi:hypothetical protein